MAKTNPIFTVDWENYSDGLHIWGSNRVVEPTEFLLDILDKYGVKAIFYILGKTASCNQGLVEKIRERGHTLGSHGYWHLYNEGNTCKDKIFRSPYFNKEGVPGFCGGFFFRLLPLWLVKREIMRTGMFFIHPHDIDEGHPEIPNPLMNWKRHVGLKTARKKLDKLLNSITWGDPS